MQRKSFFIGIAVLGVALLAIGYWFLHQGHLAAPLTAPLDTRTAGAEQALRQYIESQSGGQIKLASFKKTNGQENEVFGVKGYALNFEGAITFESDGVWLAHNPWAGGGLTFTFSKKATGFSGMNGATEIHAGGTAKISGTMSGRKSEKGWQFDVADVHTI